MEEKLNKLEDWPDVEPGHKRAWLTAYSRLGHIADSCAVAGVTRAQVRAWRAEDTAFAEACEDAELALNENLQGRAYQIATDRDKPDAQTLRWLMARRMPDVYGDKVATSGGAEDQKVIIVRGAE